MNAQKAAAISSLATSSHTPGTHQKEANTSDILHRVGIKSAPDKVYEALTTLEGLSGWWTNDTQGEGKVGGVLKFRFVAGGFDMKVVELHPARACSGIKIDNWN